MLNEEQKEVSEYIKNLKAGHKAKMDAIKSGKDQSVKAPKGKPKKKTRDVRKLYNMSEAYRTLLEAIAKKAIASNTSTNMKNKKVNEASKKGKKPNEKPTPGKYSLGKASLIIRKKKSGEKHHVAGTNYRSGREVVSKSITLPEATKNLYYNLGKIFLSETKELKKAAEAGRAKGPMKGKKSLPFDGVAKAAKAKADSKKPKKHPNRAAIDAISNPTPEGGRPSMVGKKGKPTFSNRSNVRLKESDVYFHLGQIFLEGAKRAKLKPGYSTGAGKDGGMMRKMKSGESAEFGGQQSGRTAHGQTTSGSKDLAKGRAPGSVGSRDALKARLLAKKGKK